MIPVDDDSAESVYHRVAEAIRLRRVRPHVRSGLRLMWLGDGGECAKIGCQIAANKLWSNKADCSHSWRCWWDRARGYLPPCRAPGAPIPVFVNNLNVLVDLPVADDCGNGTIGVERAPLGAHRGRVILTQNADGLMDCSVWAIQSEFEEIASPGGGVLMTHRQVWKPVRFGPRTLRQHEMGEAFHRSLRAAVNDPSFTARLAGLFRR